MPPVLRTGLDARTVAGLERLDDLFQTLRGQILIGILEDHHHWRVHAGALALDLFPGQRARLVAMERLGVDVPLAHRLQILGAAQHARRRAAYLDMRTGADRGQHELGVEGGDLQHADQRHGQPVRHIFDGGLGHPAILLLGTHEQRNHRRLLAAFRIFANRLIGPGGIFVCEGEALRLDGIIRETSNGHRTSTLEPFQ